MRRGVSRKSTHKEAAGDKLGDLQLATVACERRNAVPGDTPIGLVIVLKCRSADAAPICHEPTDVFLRLLSLLAVHLSVSPGCLFCCN